jgi:uncharacterized protein YjbI with pentapeptide repeats
MVNLNQTALKDISFKDSKLLGVSFEKCNDFLFTINFKDCDLTLSSFYKCDLAKTKFINCNLHDANFSEADLNNAVFGESDLTNAIFEKTNLEKTDFRTAINFSINPELNRISKSKFSMSGIMGLLDRYDLDIE